MMTITDTVDQFAETAHSKAEHLRARPASFIVLGLMAGAYVGLGIILIFTIGEQAEPALRKLLMGATFGIALTLIVFAGAELFTGHTMYMTHGLLRGRTGLSDLVSVWCFGWLTNLGGSFLVAAIYVAGGGDLAKHGATLLMSTAAYKMGAPAVELVARGMLCNWLVCLALWMSARTRSEPAKCILIFWCLLAFIVSGFEHSVANMTLFSIALLSPHPETVSLSGMIHNLTWVTLGNILSGSLLMGVGYFVTTQNRLPRALPSRGGPVT